MENANVIAGLRRKRAEIGGEVRELEKTLKAKRAALMSIDSTLRLFAPRDNPAEIKPKRSHRRSLYFGRNELHRLALKALRVEARLMSALEIATLIMLAKEMNPDDPAMLSAIAKRAASALNAMAKRRTVVKTGAHAATRWTLPARAE